MNVTKVSISFTKYADAAFETKAEYIVSCMTGNPAFSSPIPTLADVQTVLTKYSTDLVAAAGRGLVAVAEKNKSRRVLELLLTQLGMYVMYIANGDEAILTSSGYSTIKMPAGQQLDNIGQVMVTNGPTSGVLETSVKNVKGARSFLHEYTDSLPTEETQWESTPSSKSNYAFTKLQPGKQYWFRVAAIGTRNQLVYSSVATQFAQ